MIYKVFYNTFIGAKPLRIIYNKLDGFVRDYDGTKYLVLFDSEKYHAIFDRVIYLVGLISCIWDEYSQNYAKIKINSDYDICI